MYETEPSGQSLVKRLANTHGTRAGRFLPGADILLAAAQENYTSSTRALQKLGINAKRSEAALRSVSNSCSYTASRCVEHHTSASRHSRWTNRP